MIEAKREQFLYKEPGEKEIFDPLEVGHLTLQEFLSMPICSNAVNLRLAEEIGIKPLSLREILDQIGLEKIESAVLFDTPPSLLGNHWRVTEMTEETATIQFCSIFGNRDYLRIPPAEVSLDQVLFTGVSIQEFELDGRPATLTEASNASTQASSSPENLKNKGERIL